jgi:hypothetical protein
VTPLERELATLAEAVDWPETPDVAGAIGPRLGARRPSYRRRIAAGALALAVVTAAAVPDVRAAVGDLLGFAGGERVERVPEVPRNAPRLDLGRPVTLAQARQEAGFPVAVPAGTRDPEVRLGGALGDRTVSLVLGRDAILSQRPGQAAIFAAKQVPPGVEVRFVDVNGAQGVWIGEGPRVLVVQRDAHSSEQWSAALPGAGVLLWDRDGVALRLETRGDAAEALALARTVR